MNKNLRKMNTWNHQIIEGDVQGVRCSLGEAKQLLKEVSFDEKPHLEGYIRRATNLLSESQCCEPIETPLNLQAAKKYVQLYESALKRGKDFNLTFGDVKRLINRKTCAYTGVRFGSNPSTKKTVDRIDPKKGYVKDNVVIVTHEANQIKNKLFECHTTTSLSFQQVFKMMTVLNGKGFECSIESSMNTD